MTREDFRLRLRPEGYSRTRDHQEYGGGYSLRHGTEDYGVGWRFLDPHQHGVCVARVAASRQRPEVLQLAAFTPGESVQLRPEPDNPDGADVVGVWDDAGTVRLGQIARQNLFDARAVLYSGEPVQAIVLWDWRTEAGIRTGVDVLIAREGIVTGLDAPARRFERPAATRRAPRNGAVLVFAVLVWIALAALFGLVGAIVGGMVAVLALAGVIARPDGRP